MQKPVTTPEYASFHAYLDARAATHPRHLTESYSWAGCALTGAVGVIGWMLLVREVGPLFSILGVATTMTLFGTAFNSWVKSKIAPKSVSEKWRAQVYAAIDQYAAVRGNRRLAKCLDPVAGHILESAASYWLRIHAVLNGSLWAREGLTDTQSQIRAEALEAADAAMDEIALLCANCIGEPKKTRGEEAKNLVTDLQDLRLGAALDRLGRIASSDDPAFVHQSPNLNAVFPVIRTLAERLQQLSEEVDLLAQQAAVPGATIGMSSVGLNRIDSLIQNLQMQRAAEQELHADPANHIQQGRS